MTKCFGLDMSWGLSKQIGPSALNVQEMWKSCAYEPRRIFAMGRPLANSSTSLSKIAHRTRELIVEVLDLVATNGAGDQVGIRVKSRLIEEGLEGGFSGHVAVQVGLGE